MAYTWTDEITIQSYLNGEDGTIRIGSSGSDGFPSDIAELFENESVDDIKTRLSAAWSALPDDDGMLGRLAAKLTSAKIGTARIGTATGVGMIPEWSQRYKNEVSASITQMLVNHKTVTIVGATRRDNVSIADILILSKTRERTITPDV